MDLFVQGGFTLSLFWVERAQIATVKCQCNMTVVVVIFENIKWFIFFVSFGGLDFAFC